MDVTRAVGLPYPNLTVRLHRGSRPEMYQKIANMIKAGTGHPAVWNDEVMIEALVKTGVDLADSRDFPDFLGRFEKLLDGHITREVHHIGKNCRMLRHVRGGLLGETPDGRKANEPLSDAVSPSQGRDQKGPNAAINSVVKLDPALQHEIIERTEHSFG